MKSKSVVQKKIIEEIIMKCECCNLAMVGPEGEPYVIPMNFGYHEGMVYFHSSSVGKKLDFLRQKNKVCISFSTDHQLRWQSEKVACSYSMKYRSVLIFGKAEFVEDHDKKIEALDIIMAHYTDREFKYSLPAVKDVAVFIVKPDKTEGRVYGY